MKTATAWMPISGDGNYTSKVVVYQARPSLTLQKSGGWKMVWLDRLCLFMQLSFSAMSNCVVDTHACAECMNINSLQCIYCLWSTVHTCILLAYFVRPIRWCRSPSSLLTLPSISAYAGFTVDVTGITHEWSVRGAADPAGPDAGTQPHPHPGLHPHLWDYRLSCFCQVPPVEEVGVPFNTKWSSIALQAHA